MFYSALLEARTPQFRHYEYLNGGIGILLKHGEIYESTKPFGNLGFWLSNCLMKLC